jgi:hypothetical protein
MSWKGGPYSKNFPEREAARMVAEGLLRLDPDGSVWRLKRFSREGNGVLIPCEPNRIDYPTKRGNRYFDIRIGPNQRSKVQVSRLIWQLAKGDIPPMMTVNHKDGDPTHDALDNYELATHSEQHKHRYAVLGQESSITVRERLLATFVAAAREALQEGDLGPLREALAVYETERPPKV